MWPPCEWGIRRPDYSLSKATTGEPQCLAEILTVGISNENSVESVGFGPTDSQAVRSARKSQTSFDQESETTVMPLRDTLTQKRVYYAEEVYL